MAPRHNGNRGRCCQGLHLAENRGRTRSIQTPLLHPGPRKPGTIEPDQAGRAWADWHAGPPREAGVAASTSASAAANSGSYTAVPQGNQSK